MNRWFTWTAFEQTQVDQYSLGDVFNTFKDFKSRVQIVLGRSSFHN